jgi:hypothetical protein
MFDDDEYMRPNYGEWIAAILVLLCIACFVTPIAGSALTATLQPTYRIPIATLNDDSLIHGHFTLGSGTINEEPVYVSYAAMANGGYKMVTFAASKSTVFTDTDIAPYVQVYSCYSDFPYPHKCIWTEDEFDIHVPKGTIEQPMYALDGKL